MALVSWPFTRIKDRILAGSRLLQEDSSLELWSPPEFLDERAVVAQGDGRNLWLGLPYSVPGRASFGNALKRGRVV